MNRKHQPPYPGAVDTRLDTYLTLGHDVGFILVHGELELTQQMSPIQIYPTTTHTHTHTMDKCMEPPPQTHTICQGSQVLALDKILKSGQVRSNYYLSGIRYS